MRRRKTSILLLSVIAIIVIYSHVSLSNLNSHVSKLRNEINSLESLVDPLKYD